MADKKTQLPMQTRNVAVKPSSINEEDRTIELVWTTGAEVERCDWEGIYFEGLEVSEDAIDLSRFCNGAPVVDSHASETTDAVVGVIEVAKIETGVGTAKVRFLKDDERADRIWNKLKQNVLRFFSVGYSVQKYVEEIVDGVRHMKATKWTPLELSIVAIPADAGASIRSKEKKSECVIEKKERVMPKTKQMAKRSARSVDEQLADVIAEAEDKIEQIKLDAEEKINNLVATEDEEPADDIDAENRATDEENPVDDEQEKENFRGKRTLRASEVSEILEICTLARADLKIARGFINEGKTPAAVRRALINKRADTFESNSTVNINKPTANGKKSLSQRAAEKYSKK